MSGVPAVAWFGAAGGAYLIFAAITNRSPGEQLRAALGGDPSPAGGPLVKPAGVGTGPAGGGGAVAAPATVSTTPGTATLTGGGLVSIGQGGHKLRADAAASFARVERRVGRKVSVTDSYRSREQQADCYARKPNLCAPPGNSAHEEGLAVDVNGSIDDMDAADLVAAFTAEGWHRAGKKIAVTKGGVTTMRPEPWHWSYGVRK